MAKTMAEKNLAFKIKASERLAEEAQLRGWCSEYDDIAQRAGLAGRRWDYTAADGYVYAGLRDGDLVGEPTAKAFEAWKLQATVRLASEAIAAGIHGWEQVLTEAGFDPEQGTPKQVTYSVTLTIKDLVADVLPGQDLVEAIDRFELGQEIRWALDGNNDTITWKAKVQEATKD